jgi:hypothetical protein
MPKVSRFLIEQTGLPGPGPSLPSPSAQPTGLASLGQALQNLSSQIAFKQAQREKVEMVNLSAELEASVKQTWVDITQDAADPASWREAFDERFPELVETVQNKVQFPRVKIALENYVKKNLPGWQVAQALTMREAVNNKTLAETSTAIENLINSASLASFDTQKRLQNLHSALSLVDGLLESGVLKKTTDAQKMKEDIGGRLAEASARADIIEDPAEALGMIKDATHYPGMPPKTRAILTEHAETEAAKDLKEQQKGLDKFVETAALEAAGLPSIDEGLFMLDKVASYIDSVAPNKQIAISLKAEAKQLLFEEHFSKKIRQAGSVSEANALYKMAINTPGMQGEVRDELAQVRDNFISRLRSDEDAVREAKKRDAIEATAKARNEANKLADEYIREDSLTLQGIERIEGLTIQDRRHYQAVLTQKEKGQTDPGIFAEMVEAIYLPPTTKPGEVKGVNPLEKRLGTLRHHLQDKKLSLEHYSLLARIAHAKLAGDSTFASDPWFKMSDRHFKQIFDWQGVLGRFENAAGELNYVATLATLMREITKQGLSGEAIWERAKSLSAPHAVLYRARISEFGEGVFPPDVNPFSRAGQSIQDTETGAVWKSTGTEWILIEAGKVK